MRRGRGYLHTRPVIRGKLLMPAIYLRVVDTEVQTQALIRIQLPEGPISRKQAKTFTVKVQHLLRSMEDNPDNLPEETNTLTSNFRTLIHQPKMKISIQLEEFDPEQCRSTRNSAGRLRTVQVDPGRLGSTHEQYSDSGRPGTPMSPGTTPAKWVDHQMPE